MRANVANREEAPVRIQRISVGVVIPAALNAADVKDLSDVVAAGIGLDPARGDHIDIAAITPWIPPERNSPAVESNTSAPVRVHTSTAMTPANALPSLLWIYIGSGVGIALILACGVLVLSRRRASIPHRLSAPEREATLQRLVQWIELPERSS